MKTIIFGLLAALALSVVFSILTTAIQISFYVFLLAVTLLVSFTCLIWSLYD